MTNQTEKKRISNLTMDEAQQIIIDQIYGKISHFPKYFWSTPKGKDRVAFAIKYYLEEYLNWSIDEIPTRIKQKTFHEARLLSPINQLFNNSYIKALEFTYPHTFKEFQFKYLIRKKRGKSIAKKRKLLSDNLSEEQIKNIVNDILNENGKGYPFGFWSSKYAKERLFFVVKYYLEEYLQVKTEEIRNQDFSELIIKLKIKKPLKLYSGSLFSILKESYLDEIILIDYLKTNNSLSLKELNSLKPKDIQKITQAKLSGNISGFPKKFWVCDKAKEHFKIIILYIMKSLDVRTSQIPLYLANEYGIATETGNPLKIFFEGTRYLFEGNRFDALEFIFPDMFSKDQFPMWFKTTKRSSPAYEVTSKLTKTEVRQLLIKKIKGEKKRLPNGFWCDKERGKIALRYLVDEYLKIDVKAIPRKVNVALLEKYGLFRLVVVLFDSSLYNALNFAYPNEFKPWQLSKARNYWVGEEGKKNSIAAIKIMIKELSIPIDELSKRITIKTFEDYGLSGMLQKLYKTSPYLAINAVFPDRFKPWEFRTKFWHLQSKTTAQEAIIWLVMEKLKLSREEIFEKVKRHHFNDFGLNEMLDVFYDGSYLDSLAEVYQIIIK